MIAYLTRTWQTLAAAALACLIIGTLAYVKGRADQKAIDAAVTTQARNDSLITDSEAKEQAAVERLNDTQLIDTIERNQTDAIANATDDADVRLRAACARLRAQRGAGADLPKPC